MDLIKLALRKPITIMVLVAALVFFGIRALVGINIDIFPALDLPVIYISQPYGGYSPDQMETYFAKNYVNNLLNVNGVKSIESRNIQGLTLMKVTFYPGTDMGEAEAQLIGYCNRTQATFPPGSQPPYIMRFDASAVPVGQLILSSPKRGAIELQDLANVYLRPSFSQIPGLVSPPPFGANARTILIRIDPNLMRAHNISPDQVVQAVTESNQATPAGNVRVGNINYLTPTNTTIKDAADFNNIPIHSGGGVPNVYVKDIGHVEDGADVTSGYVLVNGKRSVYLPITKTPKASTWQTVSALKKTMPKLAAQLPADVTLDFKFDQSIQVMNSVKSLVSEGIIGALLTGLMVLLFLKDIRGALIVIMTIPICIISSILFLSLTHQTINLMTLSGLALAIGILVDESTVTIENIHQHMDMGKPKPLAIWDACREIAFPKLLILLCILAVFSPAFTMEGIPGGLFLPLALAIAFSMVTSYVMAQTLVPIVANWIMKEEHPGKKGTNAKNTLKNAGLSKRSENDTWSQREGMAERDDYNNDHHISGFEKFRIKFIHIVRILLRKKAMASVGYLVIAIALAGTFYTIIGRDIFPRTNGHAFQMRLKAPDGTRVEETEKITLKALDIMNQMVDKQHIDISSVMVGMHGGVYAISPIYLFMPGPQEACFQVAFKEDYKVDMEDFKDAYRAQIARYLPDVKVSFEPIDMTDKVLSQGSPTPIEVKLVGKDKEQLVTYAHKVIAELKKIKYLRDVQISQSVSYPTLDINIDRIRAAQLGTDVSAVSRSLVAATSSSRYTEKNLWVDPKNQVSYSVQVEVPEAGMASINDLKEVPVEPNQTHPLLQDLATVTPGTMHGENDDRANTPELSVIANLYKTDLGTATRDVQKALAAVGTPPRGMEIDLAGESNVLTDTLSGLESGLITAIVVIFLMLSANFQSFKVSAVILATVPAVLAGSLGLLLLTGSTLNLQSYMGMIMSVGVSISNSVLLITNAEHLRKANGGNAVMAAREAAGLRLRPILMTSVAMIVGMIPMASGLSEAGESSAPLGRAIIGGIIASTVAALLFSPLIFAWAMGRSKVASVSLDPTDKESRHYIPDIDRYEKK